MGLFDYVRCELPLPLGQEALYQTKDTDTQYLRHHTINSHGRLILHDYDVEETPVAERPYPNDTGLLGLRGILRMKAGSERDVDQNFDGDIEFYPDVSEKLDVHYRATFRKGTCCEICQWVDGEWKQVYQQISAGKK